MCIAIPAKILAFKENTARIDVMGIEGNVNIQLIDSPNIGDYILVHAGCAIQKIDTEYFNELQQIFKSILRE